MSLKDVVFNTNPTKKFTVQGKEIEVRGLTTKDTLELEVDFDKLLDEANTNNIKLAVDSAVKVLARTLVAIDGNKPDSVEEAKEFLLSQEQAVVMEIFNKANVFQGAEDIKN
jgi:hypothetical protein